MELEVIGGLSGALVKVTARNADKQRHQVAIQCEVKSGWLAHKLSWIEPQQRADWILAVQMNPDARRRYESHPTSPHDYDPHVGNAVPPMSATGKMLIP